MDLNPYQASQHPTPTAAREKPSIGARILRFGLTALGIGVAGIVGFVICAYFLINAGVPEPPLWLLGIGLVALVLLMLGLVASGIGFLALAAYRLMPKS